LIPESFFKPFYDEIIADDMMVVRALCHPSVSRVMDGGELCEALLAIFAHARRVTPLLFTLCGLAFEGTSVGSETASLSEHSHMTMMFRVFFTKFGADYVEKVISKIAAYIDGIGDLDLRSNSQAPEQQSKTKKAVFTVMDALLHTEQFVPKEIRHLAAVLKAVVAVQFNRHDELFRAISGFFFVRFVTTWLADSKRCGCELRNDIAKVVAPFARLLQRPFSLNAFPQRFPGCMPLNHHLVTIFPQIIRFTAAITKFGTEEEENAPDYPPPSDDELIQAIEKVLKFIYIGMPGCPPPYPKFIARYGELVEGNSTGPRGWMIGSYLLSFFKANGNGQAPSDGRPTSANVPRA
jgi:hypothetical protein